MPRIISYTPSWLSRPSPGFHLFEGSAHTRSSGQRQDGESLINGSRAGSDFLGPNRTIARRGSEIFVGVGKQIRWSDLPMLKDQWDLEQETPSKKPSSLANGKSERDKDDGPVDGSYRILKVSQSEQIRQLSISPNGHLLAIATSHTVQIAVLPDSSHLNADSNKPIKPKAFTIGPATHVLSQAPIASVLWHPLGESGSCLVTVTTDAAVRLWEFNVDNRWSASEPTLAIDLKKLVVGQSEEENFAPKPNGKNKVFSSDAIGLEVASASFGGTGSSDEAAWSAMTLWLAMSGGDVYALCPLLPSKWQPCSTLIPSLSTAIVAKAASFEEETSSNLSEVRQSDDQYQWISDLDGQDPVHVAGERETSPEVEVYKRPNKPGPVPRLQGPYQIIPEDSDNDLELSDIHVIAAKVNQGDLIDDDSDDESDFEDEKGLSSSVVCLMTRSGRVYVCLDLEGVQAQWLPRKKPKQPLPPPQDPYFVLLETLDTLKPGEEDMSEWPTFSEALDSRYSFFTTHSRGVYFFSLEPWTLILEKELHNGNTVGAPFRMDIFKNGPGTLREHLLCFDKTLQAQISAPVPACVSIQDSDIGYFLLTTHNNQPYAATLDESHPVPLPNDSTTAEDLPDLTTLAIGPARSAYQPHQAFYDPSALSTFLETHVPARHKRLMSSEIRLSTSTLDLMTEAHRVLSQETHQLGLAAADLFRRCDRLLDEFRNQIRRAGEVARRTDAVTDADVEGGDGKVKGVEKRLERARVRYEGLLGRRERLRRKIATEVQGRGLSEKEKGWRKEVEGVKAAVEAQKKGAEVNEEDELQDEEAADEDEEGGGEPWRRLEEVRAFQSDLVARARDISNSVHSSGEDNSTGPQRQDPRREKVTHVMKLLQRESSLVDTTQARLERLSLVAFP